MNGGARKPRTSVKGPLTFSAVLGLVAAVVTTLVSSGGLGPRLNSGSMRLIRWDLGLFAFGATFVVSLVMCAVLMVSHKENADRLGQTSDPQQQKTEPDASPIQEKLVQANSEAHPDHSVENEHSDYS